MNENDKIVVIILLLIYIPVILYELYYFIRGINKPKLNIKKFLRFNIILLFLSILFLALISHVNFLDYESPIPYKRINEITFKNFRGLEFIKKNLYGSEQFAYVVTSIEYKKRNDSVIIESFFHPSKSFVYSKNSNSEELLKHEIYHFKITELFTRIAKKEISEALILTDDEIENIISKSKRNERKYQNNYDSETFHSYVYQKQIKFQREIDSLLHLLNKYSVSKIKINEKK